MNNQRRHDPYGNETLELTYGLSSQTLTNRTTNTMGISVNTNIAASQAGYFLANNQQALQKSMDRLSSGKRIVDPADDAGGLAVSMKLNSTINRLRATSYNVSNAISFLQVQDGVLKSSADIVTRMGELKAMYEDVTKSASDKLNYDSEFNDLQGQLWDLAQTKFNGVRVFSDYDENDALRTANNVFGTDDDHADSTLELYVSEDGNAGESVLVKQALVLSGLNLDTNNNNAAVGFDDNANKATGTFSLGSTDPSNAANIFSLNDIEQDFITQALQNLATMRATNGGIVRNLQYILKDIENKIINHQAANGRIMDVDVALESSNLAKQRVLVQSAATMTAQANLNNDVALVLLRGN